MNQPAQSTVELLPRPEGMTDRELAKAILRVADDLIERAAELTKDDPAVHMLITAGRSTIAQGAGRINP